MGTLESLTQLAGSVDNPSLRAWKEAGRPVVGYLCSHVPTEIMEAAGILPVRLRAPGCRETGRADGVLSHLNCTFIRCVLESWYRGDLSFLDGLVCTNCCDHARRLHDVMRETKVPRFLPLLVVPHKAGTEAAVALHADALQELREEVERAFGESVTDEGLGRAIDEANQTRELLGRLYALRKADEPPITGAETLAVLTAGYGLPRPEYNRLLRQLLEELPRRKPQGGHRARLVLAGGGGCDDPEFVRVIERLGGLVVTDTLCHGSRSFWEPVAREGDLLESLARATLRRPSCANMTDRAAERTAFILSQAADFDADGVIYQHLRYCDIWGGQLLHVRRALKDADLPLLCLEREYMFGNVAQLETRVQAFLEQIEA